MFFGIAKPKPILSKVVQGERNNKKTARCFKASAITKKQPDVFGIPSLFQVGIFLDADLRKIYGIFARFRQNCEFEIKN